MLLKVEEQDGRIVNVGSGPVVLVSAISSLVTTAIALLSFWLVAKPDAEEARRLADLEFRARMLHAALQPESEQDRALSLMIMAGLNLLPAPDARLKELITASGGDAPNATIPQWKASATPETMSETAAQQ